LDAGIDDLILKDATMKYRLHVENSMKAPPFTRFTQDHVTRAFVRHPDMAENVTVSIGCDGDILGSVLHDVDFLISSVPPKDMIAATTRLRWLQTTAAGVDPLMPMTWLPKQVVLTNNSGPHAAKCEEYCLMALVALRLRVPKYVGDQARHAWAPVFMQPIRGGTCLVIGYGDLGQAACRAARTLGLTVRALSRSGNNHGLGDDVRVSDEIEAHLSWADYMIVTAPLTDLTRNIISRERLGMMKADAGLINVSRAALVDYTALADYMRRGHLSGAILDVHSPEPLSPDSVLWETPNVMITPHISCDDPRYVDLLLDEWVLNFHRYQVGQPLRNVVDLEAGY